MKLYVVSRDTKTGLYYIHQDGYPYIPVFGSFTESKRAAEKQAVLYSGFLTIKEYNDARRWKGARK